MKNEDNLSKQERREVKKEISIAMHKQLLEKATKPIHSVRREFKNQVSTAILTAFGLVIALAWKDFVTAIIPSISPPGILENFSFFGELYSAVLVTILAVIGILIVTKWFKKEENSDDNH